MLVWEVTERRSSMSTAIVSTTDVWTNWGQQLLILLEILFLVHQVDFFIPRGHGIAAFHEMNAFCLSGNLSPLEVNDFSAMTICHFPSIAYGGFSMILRDISSLTVTSELKKTALLRKKANLTFVQPNIHASIICTSNVTNLIWCNRNSFCYCIFIIDCCTFINIYAKFICIRIPSRMAVAVHSAFHPQILLYFYRLFPA